MNEIRLYLHELESMDEYSSSIPTGTVMWKMWRRRQRSLTYMRKLIGLTEGGDPDMAPPLIDERIEEFVGQYVPPKTPKDRRGNDLIGIRWFRVVLKQGPAPPNYSPPDWSNYAGYKREAERDRAQRNQL